MIAFDFKYLDESTFYHVTTVQAAGFRRVPDLAGSNLAHTSPEKSSHRRPATFLLIQTVTFSGNALPLY